MTNNFNSLKNYLSNSDRPGNKGQKIVEFIVSFIITFIIKYLLSQNKNDIGSIIIDTIKFVIANFISKIIIGLIYIYLIHPNIRACPGEAGCIQSLNDPIFIQILEPFIYSFLFAIFLVISKYIDSIGNPDKPFNLDNLTNLILQQLLTHRMMS